MCASQTESVECDEEYDQHGDSCQCDDCYNEWMATNQVDENDYSDTNDYGENEDGGSEQMLFVA